MIRTTPKFLVLSLLFLAVALPTQAQAARSCGTAGTLYSGAVSLTRVKAEDVPCTKARSFARRFEKFGGPACGEDFYCMFKSWSCRNDGRSLRYVDHRCELLDKVVRWRTQSTTSP